MPEQQQLSPLNERIERDVRMLIGDMHMQLIVTRAMLEIAQGNQQAQVSVPQPEHKPNGGARQTVAS